MTPALASALLPLVRAVDPERAHGFALRTLRWGLAGSDTAPFDPRLEVRTLGLRFSNPIGLAAGFDKDAVAVAPLTRLGFGFVETGTVTPRPQAGNPRPRVFRLSKDRAVINRMGFNNCGLDDYLRNLAAGRKTTRPGVLVGANVGINKEGADPECDYPALVAAVTPHADYVVINVSSPNTPGLRDLQAEARLQRHPAGGAHGGAAASAAAGQDRPRPVRGRAGGGGHGQYRGRRRGPDRVQHHHLAPARAAVGLGGGSRRPVRSAAAGAVERRAAASRASGRRPAGAGGGRRGGERRATF